MNFEAQKMELNKIMIELREREKYYEAEEMGAIIECAMTASKTDMRHAQGILDRLLKSKYLEELVEENKKNEQNKI
jgi:hypothetical protein